jgi:rSAM/selenodomain-associated transferase 1
MNAIVLFGKYPEPGKVKKKIGQVIGMEMSARLCKAMLSDIIDKTSNKDYDLYLSFIGREYKEQYRTIFPSTILYVQRGTNIIENVKYTFEDLLDDHEKVLIISGDAPQVTHDLVQRAFNALNIYDVVIWPAEDGGYYLIGLKRPLDIFEGMPFGTDQLVKAQVERIKQKKLTCVLLEKMGDVDTPDELKQMKKVITHEDAPNTYDVLQEIDF